MSDDVMKFQKECGECGDTDWCRSFYEGWICTHCYLSLTGELEEEA